LNQRFINKSNSFFLRLILSGFLLFWTLGFLSPCISFNTVRSIYPLSRIFYSTVCHQNELKSFNCDGVPILVCARCTGIYFGAFLSSLIILGTKKIGQLNFNHLLIFSLPMLLDVIFLTSGLYTYNKTIALSTGFLFGSTIFLYILKSVEDFLFYKNNSI